MPQSGNFNKFLGKFTKKGENKPENCLFASIKQLPHTITSTMDTTSGIRQLNKEEIEKLSSGQVVVSPLHIVKELLENSIDANSKKISVTLKSSSSNKTISEISIQDNGDGIKKENFEFLCKTHYTSKLKGTSSFGYRGEALSFISRNSKVTIQSCTG